jgi:hypothetical protein
LGGITVTLISEIFPKKISVAVYLTAFMLPNKMDFVTMRVSLLFGSMRVQPLQTRRRAGMPLETRLRIAEDCLGYLLRFSCSNLLNLLVMIIGFMFVAMQTTYPDFLPKTYDPEFILHTKVEGGPLTSMEFPQGRLRKHFYNLCSDEVDALRLVLPVYALSVVNFIPVIKSSLVFASHIDATNQSRIVDFAGYRPGDFSYQEIPEFV